MTVVLGQGTLAELRHSVRGEVIAPGDPTYDDARRVWNAMIDRRPALIVRCAGLADVITAVQFARSQDLEIAVRGGGHSLPGFSTTDGGVVVDLSRMRAVRVDAEQMRAVAGGGATWHDLDHETQSFGLAVTGGLMSGTGIAGFSLGGGIGWLMRSYGLACDNLVGAELVTADGQVVRASETENADLLWGLRGGGGNFGVVTALEFRLNRVGPMVLAGPVFYRAQDAVAVLRAWRSVAAEAVDELTTLVSLGSGPPIPPLPEEFHGQKVVTVVAAYAGNAAAGSDAAAPLRSLAEPIVDLLGEIPYVDFQGLPDPFFGAGARNYFTSSYLRGLPDVAIEVLTRFHAECPSPFSEIHVHQMGGAVGRLGLDSSAFGNRNAPFLLNVVARWFEPGEDELQLGWARGLRTAMEPFSTGGAYVNFLGVGDDRVKAAYDDERYARLRRLKHAWDPANVFHLNQNIPPAD